MKNRKISLQRGIFTYLLLFTVITFTTLWCFQVISLDNFYRAMKTSSVKSVTQYIVKNIDNENLKELIIDVSEKNEVFVIITSLDGEVIYAPYVFTGTNVMIPKSHTKELGRILNEQTDSLIVDIDRDLLRDNIYQASGLQHYKSIIHDENGNIRLNNRSNQENNNVVYAHLAINKEGKRFIVAATANLVPVKATVNTIRWQLVIITIIMIIISLLLALVISRGISDGIIKINQKSKEFSKGNYNVTFDTDRYKEISELATTLNGAAKELSRVDEIRKEFVANVSHDLRTPLMMITGYAEAIRDLPNENTAEDIQIVIEEAERLTSLVNDLLDVTRLETGTFTLENAEYSLTKDIKEILHRYEGMLEKEKYTINFIYDKEVIINADKLRISQVIYNFINNAITHAGGNKVIDIKQTIVDDYVRLEVIDYGKGIEKEKLKDIWNRYYKVDKEHKRAQIGIGIGLCIISQILDLYDSEYGVESELGHGSDFWFKIKYVKTSNKVE